MITVMHDVNCEGGHTAEVSCAEVAAWRVRESANPNHCWHGRNGYHWFADAPDPAARCRYEGCERTYGELLVVGDK